MGGLAGPVARALVESVRSSHAPSVGALPSLEPLVAAAATHGVSGFVWRAVRSFGLQDRPDAQPLRIAAAVAAGRHLRALAELERIEGALSGLPWLLFKGPVLACLVHGSPTLRSPVDLDLLVPRACFGEAVAGLERAGYVVYERNWTLVRRAGLGSLRLHSPAGALVDLHWDLLNDRAERRAFAVSSAQALQRARTVRLGTVPARTLDPVDTVVHLALHAALAGAHRLVWLADVAAACRRLEAAELAAVPARALDWSVAPAVDLVLARSAAVLGREALEVPRPAAGLVWRVVAATADRVAPVSRWSGGRSVAAAVARSARAGSAASLRELAVHALAALRGHGGRPVPQTLFDQTDPASVAYPCGGAVERGAYLEEVGAPSTPFTG